MADFGLVTVYPYENGGLHASITNSDVKNEAICMVIIINWPTAEFPPLKVNHI